MYRAKAAGRNGHRIFDFELRTDIQHRKQLEQELCVAMTNEQLEFYNQPFVEDGTGVVECYEALMRWNHPTHLILKITETVILSNESITDKSLLKIHTLGVLIVFNNFDTGFSSLSYLQRFPFNKVKIDR